MRKKIDIRNLTPQGFEEIVASNDETLFSSLFSEPLPTIRFLMKFPEQEEALSDYFFSEPERAFKHINVLFSLRNFTLLHQKTLEFILKQKQIFDSNHKIFGGDANNFLSCFPGHADFVTQCLLDHLKSQKLNNPHLEKSFDLILHFLSSKQPSKLKHLSKLQISLEILSLLSNPENIQQDKYNLCGPATFFVMLAVAHPESFTKLACEFALNGYTKEPVILKAVPDSLEQISSICKAMNFALKHSYNKTGYSPTLFEQLRGQTTPQEMCKWLSLCHFTEIKEFTLVTDTQQNEVGKFTQYLFEIYHEKHTPISRTKEDLVTLSKLMEQKNQIALLITEGLYDVLKEHTEKEMDPDTTPKKPSGILGIISASHFIYLKHFAYQPENNTLNIDFITYGKSYHLEKVPAEVFLKGYQGGIAAIPPQKELTKEHTIGL